MDSLCGPQFISVLLAVDPRIKDFFFGCVLVLGLFALTYMPLEIDNASFVFGQEGNPVLQMRQLKFWETERRDVTNKVYILLAAKQLLLMENSWLLQVNLNQTKKKNKKKPFCLGVETWNDWNFQLNKLGVMILVNYHLLCPY